MPRARERFLGLLTSRYEREYDKLESFSKEDRVHWMRQSCQMIDLQILNECAIAALRIFDADDLFDLFIDSFRVRVDLRRDLETNDPQLQICVREFDFRIEYHLEFRTFVCRNHLTAVTQYDDRLYFKEVEDNKDVILNAIRVLFEEKVRPAFAGKNVFPGDSYVADFGVILSKSGEAVIGGEAVLIEINRFNSQTGPSLFSWEEDIEVLTGEKPFEFRVAPESRFESVDYELQLEPDFASMKNEVKAEIVQRRKSWFEKWFTWRNNEDDD
jgi:hypothetical protein